MLGFGIDLPWREGERPSLHMQVSISIDAQSLSIMIGFMLTGHSTSSGGMESNKKKAVRIK